MESRLRHAAHLTHVVILLISTFSNNRLDGKWLKRHDSVSRSAASESQTAYLHVEAQGLANKVACIAASVKQDRHQV